MRTGVVAAILCLIMLGFWSGCTQPSGPLPVQITNLPEVSVTYFATGATAGAPPVDSTAYHPGETVTVAGNSGNLSRVGYDFDGWITGLDGTHYDSGATFVIDTADVELISQWSLNTDLEFLSVWDTANLSAGSSADNQVTLPLTADGECNIVVAWGDGTTDTITAYDDAATTHTYPAPEVYEISIRGLMPGFAFDGSGDLEKLTEIKSWGALRLGMSAGDFKGCTNLTVSALDAPILDSTRELAGTFQGCTSLDFVPGMDTWDVSGIWYLNSTFQDAVIFNQPIGSWDVSNVAEMDSLFNGAFGVNQDFGSWDVTGVVTMVDMFAGVTMDPANYDSLLIGWESLTGLQNGVVFSGGDSRYNVAAATARSNLISTWGWTITDGGPM